MLRSYVFDDNADILGYSGSPRSRAGLSTNSDNAEFSTRHLFTGRVVPTLYIPGHGHILPPAPRPTSQEWNNPRDYWRSRQRVSSTGQLSSLTQNQPLSIISEEVGSPAGSSQPPSDLQRTSTPMPSHENLLVDVHYDDNQEVA